MELGKDGRGRHDGISVTMHAWRSVTRSLFFKMYLSESTCMSECLEIFRAEPNLRNCLTSGARIGMGARHSSTDDMEHCSTMLTMQIAVSGNP